MQNNITDSEIIFSFISVIKIKGPPLENEKK